MSVRLHSVLALPYRVGGDPSLLCEATALYSWSCFSAPIIRAYPFREWACGRPGEVPRSRTRTCRVRVDQGIRVDRAVWYVKSC